MALDTPGVDGRFRVPHTPTDLALLAVGRLFAREAAPLRDLFIAHGLPETFMDELQALVARFEQAVRARAAGREARAAARVRVTQTLESGVTAVQKLEVIIANQLPDDAATQAAWREARRVSPARRSRATPVTPGARPSARTAPALRNAGPVAPAPPSAATGGAVPAHPPAHPPSSAPASAPASLALASGR